MIKKIGIWVFAALVLFLVVQFAYGGSRADVPAKDSFEVIAHRGAHVNWEKGTYDLATGCEATHIYSPTHSFIENTIESIGAAFDMGATIVEIDIHRTSDDQLVIFHDSMLECRTDGQGDVSDHPLAYLQSLDIGYGYTHDGGQTYPFRGKGVGKMPTLVEVLETYPDRKLWIDHKDGTMETARLLVEILKTLPPEQQEKINYWGTPDTWDYVQQEIPAATRLLGNRPEMKECLLPYFLTLGLGPFPKECQGRGIGLPAQYTTFAPGWPYRFLSKVSDAGARFYLTIETADEASAFLDVPLDGVITDHIEDVGPFYARVRASP